MGLCPAGARLSITKGQSIVTAASTSPADPPRTEPDIFSTEHLASDLKGRAVRGGMATVGGRLFTMGMETASSVFLARLLTPADFGLMAMITAALGFLLVFRDFGLSAATIQRRQVTQGLVSTLFWVNAGMGLLLAVIVAGLAPVLARFYGKPELIGLTIGYALTVLFGGLAVQHLALMKRQMRFGHLELAKGVALFVSLVVGVLLAWRGLGVWTLIVIEVVQAVLLLGLLMWFCRWWPSWPRRGTGAWQAITFGSHLTGSSLLNFLARNLDGLLIGRYWGEVALGIYAKAYRLLMMPIRQINAPMTGVAVPVLSRLQNDPERYRAYYRRALNIIAVLTTPAIAVSMALADEIVLVVLGSQWGESARIFRVLGLAAWVQVFLNTTGWIYVSLGQGKRMLFWNCVAIPVVLLSFAAGLPWGAYGVAVSYTLCCILLIAPTSLAYAFHASPVRMKDLLTAIGRPFFASVLVFIAVVIARELASDQHSVVRLGLGLATAGFVLALAALCWAAFRSDLQEALALLRGGMRAGSNPMPAGV